MSECGGYFQYNPLDPKIPSIRLLRLLKAHNGPIKCELYHSTLHESPNYEALSYAWGSDERVERISLDSKTMWITDNLHAALQNLRWCDQDRILWIDAICIDQESLLERNHQIQQMAKIFSGAVQVIFWLGKPTLDVIAFMETLQKLQITRPVTNSVYQELEARCLPGLKRLLQRSWFERVWILQEVVKAREAVVCSGIYSIPAQVFASAAFTLGLQTHMNGAVLRLMPGPAREIAFSSQQWDLDSLLLQFQMSKASDERDKIYALHSLASGPAADAISLDYGRTAEDVVRRCTHSLLKLTGIALHNLLDFLTTFRTLNFICLIWSSTKGVQSEFLDCSTPISKEFHPLEYLDSTGKKHFVDRASISIITERKLDESSNRASSCYTEVTELMSRYTNYSGRHRRPGLEVIPWKSVEQNVKLLVVGKVGDAILDTLDYGHEQIHKLLVRTDKNGNNARARASVTNRDARGRTPLHSAVRCRNAAEVKRLLDTGMCHIHPSDGIMVHWAVSRYQERIVKLLLNYSNNFDINLKKKYSQTPLALAVSRDNEAIVKLLLDYPGNFGIDINARDNHGLTVLSIAVARKSTAIVKLLLSHRQIEVNSKDSKDKTPLAVAAFEGSTAIVGLLLGHSGTMVNYRDDKNRTPLWWAVDRGHADTVKLLLESTKIKVGAKDVTGTTPLSLAASQNHEVLVKLLLQHGCKTGCQHTKDEYGDTPLSIAAANGYDKIVNLLCDYGCKIDCDNKISTKSNRRYDW